MKKYFEIRINKSNYFWHLVELLESTQETETFVFIRNNKKETLNKKDFSVRELSVDKRHLEKLGFYDYEKKKFVSNKGLFVEPIYFHKKESETIATEEFLGYIIYEKGQTKDLNKIYSELYEDFFHGKINDKTIPRKKLNCFYSLNYLFTELKNTYKIDFNELDIVRN